MRTRIAGAIAVCLVFASAVACGGATPTATPTQTLEAVPKATATPTQAPLRAGPTPSKLKTPATFRVTGTITYRERMALSPDAVVEVKLSVHVKDERCQGTTQGWSGICLSSDPLRSTLSRG